MKYEYLIIPTAASSDARSKDQTQTALNEQGTLGWRIVSTIPSTNGTWILMEKESVE
jgi:hypothetical protein